MAFGALTIVGVSIMVFVVMRILPGDPLVAIFGPEGMSKLTEEQRAHFMKDLGLSDPLWVQYFAWVKDILAGNFGRSFFRSESVADMILRRGPLTAEIALLSVLTVGGAALARRLQGASLEGGDGLGQEVPVVLPVIGDQQPLHQDALADHLGEVARAARLALAVVLLNEATQHYATVYRHVVEGCVQHGAPHVLEVNVDPFRGEPRQLGIEILVLDEADQMLDLGFIHALRRIVKELPSKRQSLFFSATMPKTIRELASQFIQRLRPDPFC